MNIAIVGTGISGLVSAYLLNRTHNVTIFEANDYIGGHTCTVDVPTPRGAVAVDTGFIVFNENTYPNFIKLIDQLGVAWQPSDMSFSVQCEKTGLVFSPSTFNSLFAQRANLLRPRFYRMLLDALRFRRESAGLIGQTEDGTTLAAYLQENGYSPGFVDNLIVPMGAAIWSADPERFMDFPVHYLAAFFHNHGFLNIKDQPRWCTIRGGSRQYVGPLVRSFHGRIRLNSPVAQIQRRSDGVTIALGDTSRHAFDQVVIAAHADQALRMLADPSDREAQILGAIGYQENLTVLHTDTRLMPSKHAAWASWNYRIPRQAMGRVALTYHMNRLQALTCPEQFCVTLNMPDAIDTRKKISTLVYHHPVYDPKGLAARRRRPEINGVNRTWFCGAYWGYGFHEDGVNSALAVADHFGLAL